MHWKIFIITSITAITLEVLLIAVIELPLITAIISSFIIISVGYLFWFERKSRKINTILEEDCDPVKFINKMEQFKSISTRIVFQNFCNVNIAIALIALARYDEAFNVLDNIELRKKNSKLFELAYHLTLVSYYLHTGDLEKVAYEYNHYLKEIRKSILIPKYIFCFDATVLMYHYNMNQSTETTKYYLAQLEYLYNNYAKKLSKRLRLNVVYNRAVLLHELGNYEEAMKKYKIVEKNGNSLWIANLSSIKLKEIETIKESFKK